MATPAKREEDGQAESHEEILPQRHRVQGGNVSSAVPAIGLSGASCFGDGEVWTRKFGRSAAGRRALENVATERSGLAANCYQQIGEDSIVDYFKVIFTEEKVEETMTKLRNKTD